MKKIYFSRLWRLMLLCCIAITSQAQTVKIEGYNSVGTEQGYPLFIVAEGTITVSSSSGSFYDIYIDDTKIACNFSSYWSSYSIDITPYCDGNIHKLQLARDISNYGICYITSNEDLFVDGIHYSIENEAAIVTGALYNIEDAIIHETCTKDGVTYPVVAISSNVFKNIETLKSVTIPESVTSIGTSAFYGCTNLTSLTFNAANCSSCGSLDYPAFPSTISDLTIGDKVTRIPANFLYNGIEIENLVIPNSVTSIGSYAFYNINSLKSLTLGSGLLTIEHGAFPYYNKIAKAFWLGNTPPSGYNNVSAEVNYVSNSQYTMSNRLQYQFLSSMFEVDGVKYIPVSPSDRTCDVVDCIYTNDYKDVTISDKVTNKGIEMSVIDIKQYAFYDNDYIQSLDLSNGGEICDYAFYGCKNTLEATLGENVTGIGNSVFYGCSSLKDIVIPNSVKSLGSSAFQDCSSLTSVSIGTSVPALPTYIFSGCSSLGSLSIPNNITSVGNYAFERCSSLSDITIEDAEKADDKLTLGSNVRNPLFSDCPLDEVYIGRKLSYQTSSSYGYSPFYRNTSLRTVEISDAETQIYDNEFYGCTNLKSLKIGNGVKTIGNWAFSGCSSLDYFSAGNHVESIGKEAFSDCTGLTKYYSYSVVPPVCSDQALDDINKWECTLYVPAESSDEYQAAAQWKDFFFVEEMDAADGVNDVASETSAVCIKANGRTIIIEGKNPQDRVNIYNVQGTLVESTNADKITLSECGVFVVRIGNVVYKIRL